MKRSTREIFAAYMFLTPNLVGFLLFVSLPVIASLLLSLFRWDGLTWPPQFVGLDNFREILGWVSESASQASGPRDPEFWQYWGNTLFLMLGIPLQIGGALFVAVLLNRKIRGVVAYRVVFFMPTITAGVAIYILWRWLLNPQYGLINEMLSSIGISGPAWLESLVWAKPAMILMSIWIAMGGFNMMIFLAALQNIDPTLYEAARVDGANRWHQFWNITLPMLRPTMFFVVTMSIINGFQSGFEQAYIMTQGGPAGATTTVSYYIYNLAYRDYRMGYAAAVAWLLFFVVLVVTLLNWRFGKKDVA